MIPTRFLKVIAILVVIMALVLSACGSGGNDDKDSGKNGQGKGKTKILICHSTEDPANPYVELSLPESALKGHERHDGDIIPAPEGGCP